MLLTEGNNLEVEVLTQRTCTTNPLRSKDNPKLPRMKACQFVLSPAQETVSQQGVIKLSDLCLIDKEVSLVVISI